MYRDTLVAPCTGCVVVYPTCAAHNTRLQALCEPCASPHHTSPSWPRSGPETEHLQPRATLVGCLAPSGAGAHHDRVPRRLQRRHARRALVRALRQLARHLLAVNCVARHGDGDLRGTQRGQACARSRGEHLVKRWAARSARAAARRRSAGLCAGTAPRAPTITKRWFRRPLRATGRTHACPARPRRCRYASQTPRWPCLAECTPRAGRKRLT